MAPFVCFKFNLSKYSSPIHFFYENIFSGVVYALQMKMMQSNHAVRVAVWLSEAILYVVACGDFVWNFILNKKSNTEKVCRILSPYYTASIHHKIGPFTQVWHVRRVANRRLKEIQTKKELKSCNAHAIRLVYLPRNPFF